MYGGSTGGPEWHGALLQVTVQALARDGAQRACNGLLDNVVLSVIMSCRR